LPVDKDNYPHRQEDISRKAAKSQRIFDRMNRIDRMVFLS
jgi:hypothetical protein